MHSADALLLDIGGRRFRRGGWSTRFLAQSFFNLAGFAYRPAAADLASTIHTAHFIHLCDRVVELYTPFVDPLIQQGNAEVFDHIEDIRFRGVAMVAQVVLGFA